MSKESSYKAARNNEESCQLTVRDEFGYLQIRIRPFYMRPSDRIRIKIFYIYNILKSIQIQYNNIL